MSDYIFSHPASRDARAEDGRCAACGRRVDAWICLVCALGHHQATNQHLQSRDRWVTATQVSRATQRRVDQAMAHEQYITMVGLNDSGVVTVGRESYRQGEMTKSSEKRRIAILKRANGGLYRLKKP